MGSATQSVVIIGQIGAPYGVKGWMHVRSFTEPATNLENFSDWQISLQDAEKGRIVHVEKFKIHNDHYIAKLVDVEDRDAAASFTNWQIAVKRDLLPTLNSGEYYWADLLGFTVYNQDGTNYGEVTDFLATGANDVLIVRQQGKEHLIPYVVGTYILEVCLEKKEMQVAWDEEL